MLFQSFFTVSIVNFSRLPSAAILISGAHAREFIPLVQTTPRMLLVSICHAMETKGYTFCYFNELLVCCFVWIQIGMEFFGQALSSATSRLPERHAYTVRFLDIGLGSVPPNFSSANCPRFDVTRVSPPKILYNDSAARHVDARASAKAHKNADGSISKGYIYGVQVG